jgi:hypothetical protein
MTQDRPCPEAEGRYAVAEWSANWVYERTHDDLLAGVAYVVGYFTPEIVDWSARFVIQQLTKPKPTYTIAARGFRVIQPTSYPQFF